MAKNNFQYAGWNSLESWQWIHQVAAPCNVTRGCGMTCHWIRPNVHHIGILHMVSISTRHRSRHVIMYQSAKFYPNRTTLSRKQELSYRQQIARQLRTQYAEGIYRPKYYTVTLKSRLRVTQGHWKRNHWIDHTRLSSSRVIWRLILLWLWNVG